jgi:hypothetical protein
MLTGELPLGRFDPPSVRGADTRLDPIVLRALEKAPARRFASAAEMGAALGAVSTRPAGPPPRRVPGRWVVGAAAVVLAGVAVVVTLAVRAGRGEGAAPPATPTPPSTAGGGGSGVKGPRENPPAGPHGKRLVEFRGANLVLSDRAAQALELSGPDRVKVETLMRATVASVVRMERSHSKVVKTDAGRVRVEVLPYVKEASDERARFARELSGMLTEKQRLSLSSGRPVSELSAEKGQPAEEFARWVEESSGGFDDLFSGSERGRVVEMWKEGGTYHLTDSASRARDPEQTGVSPTVFPPRYRPYWVLYGSESADLAELVAELQGGVGKDPGGRKRPGDRLRLAERIRTMPEGEARVRKLLEDAGMEAPAAAGPSQLAGRLEQLARSLQGLPELEEER